MSSSNVSIMHYIGWGIFALGGCAGANIARQLARWKRGYGKVIGYEIQSDGENGTLYYPRIKISGAALEGSKFVSKVGSHSESWKIGERVRIFYHRDGKKTQGEVVSWGALVAGPVVLIGIGLILLLAE